MLQQELHKHIQSYTCETAEESTPHQTKTLFISAGHKCLPHGHTETKACEGERQSIVHHTREHARYQRFLRDRTVCYMYATRQKHSRRRDNLITSRSLSSSLKVRDHISSARICNSKKHAGDDMHAEQGTFYLHVVQHLILHAGN